MKKIILIPLRLVQFIFIGIFFLFLPVLIVFSWLRFHFKKTFHLKPSVIISPLGGPLPLYAVKALRAQGYLADNYALDCPSYFRNIIFGFVLSDHPILRYLIIASDHLLPFAWAVLKYDIFEFAFSGGFLMHSHLRRAEYILLKLCSKKISVYGYGSDCKVMSEVRRMGFKYNNAMDRTDDWEAKHEELIRANVLRAKKYADVLIAGGDLIHFGGKGIMLPLATDLGGWRFYKLPEHEKVVIAHSTNHRTHKGTRFILDCFERLKDKLPIKMMLIEGKPMEECRKMYPKADIFIPDVISGWHGFTAIEAMATGRPVITYLRPDIMAFHAYYAQGNIPAVSANPDTLAGAITKLVKNQKLREDLGQKGRKYAMRYHSLEFVGALRSIIYEHIWNDQKINQKIFEKVAKNRGLI